MRALLSALFLVPAAGGELTHLLDDGHGNNGPAWTDDDRTILVTVSSTPAGGGDIWDIGLQSKQLRRLTNGAQASVPIPPSTGRIAFLSGATKQACTVYLWPIPKMRNSSR